MKTLLVTMDYAPNVGGVAAYWQRVRESLPSDELVVLTSVPGQTSTGVLRRPLFFARLWPRWLRAIRIVAKTYRQQGCSQLLVGQVLPIGTVAYLLWRWRGIPYVVQVYGMDLLAAWQSKRKQWLVRRVLAGAQHCLANSQATADLLAEFGVAAERITIIYPIPAPAQQKVATMALDKKHWIEGKRVILCVGRLVERKGQDTLIRAMARLRAQFPDVVTVLVGEGPDKTRLAALAKQENAPVIMTGRVSAAERDAWLHRCEIFAMPGRPLSDDVEGFGMVYLEAAAAAKPVVAGKSGGVSEAVLDGETGLVVDGTSVEVVVAALERLLKDKAFAQRLGQAAQARLSRAFSWDEMITRLRHVLAQASSSTRL